MSCPDLACSSAVSFAATSGWSIKSPANVELCWAAKSFPILAMALSLSSLNAEWPSSRSVVDGPAATRCGQRSVPVATASPVPPAAFRNPLRVIFIPTPPVLVWDPFYPASARRPAPVTSSSSHRAGGQAGHVMIQEQREQQDHGHRRHQRAAHQRSPVKEIPADEIHHDAGGYGFQVGGGDERQRVDELAVGQRKPEEGRGDDPRPGQGQHHVPQRAGPRASIDEGAL